MNAHSRHIWLIVGSLLVIAIAGLALGTPTRVIAQAEGTPTYSAPPPRTVPPGIRETPTPEPAQATPNPPQPSAPAADTPTAGTPASTPALVPVTGADRTDGDAGLSVALIGLGSVLLALGAVANRRRLNRR